MGGDERWNRVGLLQDMPCGMGVGDLVMSVDWDVFARSRDGSVSLRDGSKVCGKPYKAFSWQPTARDVRERVLMYAHMGEVMTERKWEEICCNILGNE